MYIQTKDLTASRVLYKDKIALRCHILNLETYKNANLVCTWCMCSVYQSYTRFSSYSHLFLVYSWHIAVISNIPGVYSHLPIIVSQSYIFFSCLNIMARNAAGFSSTRTYPNFWLRSLSIDSPATVLSYALSSSCESNS